MADMRHLDVVIDGLENDVESLREDIKKINERMDCFLEKISEDIAQMVLTLVDKSIGEALNAKERIGLQVEIASKQKKQSSEE